VNLGNLRSRLRSWLGVDSTRLPDEAADDCINITRKQLVRELDLSFGEVTGTLPAVASTQTAAIPARFSNPFSLWFLNDDGKKAIVEFVTKGVFDTMYPDPAITNDPANYTIWGGTVYFGPTPKRNLSLTFNYYALPEDLDDDSDEDAMMIAAWETILWGALAFASRNLIEDERTGIWDELYTQGRATLQIEHARISSAGKVSQAEEPH
jgi:hypothetical protein